MGSSINRHHFESYFFNNVYKNLEKTKVKFIEKNKNRLSIEKMMFYLTIFEFIISIYWFVNSLLFTKMKDLLDPTLNKCKQCLYSSLFALFFQNFDWMIFICTLYNLLKFFEDPAHEKSGFAKKRKWYFIVSIIVALIYSYFIFLDFLGNNPDFVVSTTL